MGALAGSVNPALADCSTPLTTARTVYTFDCVGGELSSRRAFGQPFAAGLPDGSALDSEGYIWNCRVGGASVVRFAPDGSVDTVVELPCLAPTSCAFGGDGLRTLLVTSARFGLSETQRSDADQGAVFALEVGVSGRPEYLFG